jgi:aromatase
MTTTVPVISLDEYTGIINSASGAGLGPGRVLDLTAPFDAMAVDSLGVLGILSALELRFGLEPDIDAKAGRTPGGLLFSVYERLIAAGRLPSGRTEQAIRIDAPFGEVWEQTNDVPAWPRLFSEYESAEILSADGDTVTFRLTMHPDESGTKWSWVSERTVDRAAGTARARRVETGPFEFMDILWTYTDLEGGGVELRWRQEFAMKPQAPVDTAWMTANITVNSAAQLALIRDRVQERARARAR